MIENLERIHFVRIVDCEEVPFGTGRFLEIVAT